MALSDCYDCELDFVKKEILHTRSVFEGQVALSAVYSIYIKCFNAQYAFMRVLVCYI